MNGAGHSLVGVTEGDLAALIAARARGHDRFIVALAGPPGSGKTTLASALVGYLGPEAAVLPMDGFHLDNDRLHALGLFHRKGAPETFDVDGFGRMLRDVRSQPAVLFPTFDRAADKTVPDAGQIHADTRIVIAEGNYLLLSTPPWSDLGSLFDLTIRLDVRRALLEERLVARWLAHGLPPAEAKARALNNDLRNADHVMEHSSAPDLVWSVPA